MRFLSSASTRFAESEGIDSILFMKIHVGIVDLVTSTQNVVTEP